MAAKYPQTTVDEDPMNNNLAITNDFTKACLQREWETVFTAINKDVCMTNLTLVTGLTPLHHVAMSGDITAMMKMLNYPTCNQGILRSILEGDFHLSNEMKSTLEWKTRKMKLENISIPIITEISECDKVLSHYVLQSVRANKGIYWKIFEPEKCVQFHEICGYVFYSVTDNTLSTVKNVVNRELSAHGIAVSVDCITEEFYERIVQIYTENGISKNAIKELYDQTSVQRSGVFFTLLSAVLLYWKGLGRCTATTYRGVRIEQREIDRYKVTKEFSWLVFATCCTEKVSKEFEGNCVFQIDNRNECHWSPRYLGNDECVYPCGAQFRVVKMEKVGVKMWIHLKLIDTNNYGAISNNVKSNLNKIVANIKTKCSEIKTCHKNYTEESKAIFDLNKARKNKNLIRNIYKKEVVLENGYFAYNCQNCQVTCHEPCNDTKERLCQNVITEKFGGCGVCPGKCHYTKHKKERHKIEITGMTEEIEDDVVIDNKDLVQAEKELKLKIAELKQLKLEFNKIACFMEIVLNMEEKKNKGFKERVKATEEMKKFVSSLK